MNLKELRIPKAITVRLDIGKESLGSREAVCNVSDGLKVIERNGSEIMTAAIMIEDRMIEATTLIFFD